MALQVVRGAGGVQEAEMPRVLGGAFEPELIEGGGHPEQRAQRRRDTQPIGSNDDVGLVVPT